MQQARGGGGARLKMFHCPVPAAKHGRFKSKEREVAFKSEDQKNGLPKPPLSPPIVPREWAGAISRDQRAQLAPAQANPVNWVRSTLSNRGLLPVMDRGHSALRVFTRERMEVDKTAALVSCVQIKLARFSPCRDATPLSVCRGTGPEAGCLSRLEAERAASASWR